MQKNQLREIAKFCAGLIAGDFVFGLWVITRGLIPFTFLGVTWTLQACIIWMVFDAVLVAFLMYYGWYIPERPRTSNERLFLNSAGCVFAVVAAIHLLRILFGWTLVVGSWPVPYWLNAIGAVVTIFLSYTSFHFARPHKK